MRMSRLLSLLLVAGTVATGHMVTAEAAGPRNPYSSFNLSGINWGSQQWERDQRAGRVVWPYYNVPARSPSVRSSAVVGGVNAGGGPVIERGVYRASPRTVRRWRR